MINIRKKYIKLASVILILLLIICPFIFKDAIERQLIITKYAIKEFNRKSAWDENQIETSKLVYLGKINNYKVYHVDFFVIGVYPAEASTCYKSFRITAAYTPEDVLGNKNSKFSIYFVKDFKTYTLETVMAKEIIDSEELYNILPDKYKFDDREC